MSIMVCSACCGYIDTDFDCDGIYEDKGTRFWCWSCVESKLENGETPETSACVAAFAEQKPEEYSQWVEA